MRSGPAASQHIAHASLADFAEQLDVFQRDCDERRGRFNGSLSILVESRGGKDTQHAGRFAADDEREPGAIVTGFGMVLAAHEALGKFLAISNGLDTLDVAREHFPAHALT